MYLRIEQVHVHVNIKKNIIKYSSSNKEKEEEVWWWNETNDIEKVNLSGTEKRFQEPMQYQNCYFILKQKQKKY